MGKFLKTRKDRVYAGVATTGSVAAGAVTAVATSAIGWGSGAIALDIGVALTALVGSVIFRPRSDAEIKMLLGKSAMIDEIEQVASSPATSPAIAAVKTRKEAEKKLIAVMDKVLRVKTALGTDITDAVTPIFENLSIITKKWDALEGYTEVRYTVETMMDDYLPTSINSYLAIPTKGDAKLAAKLKADLLDQLGILEAETAKIRKNLLIDDIQEFNVQSSFLKSRFQQSNPTNELTFSQQLTYTTDTKITVPAPKQLDIPLPPSFQ